MIVYSLVFSFMPGIDMAAHVGGLVAGIAIGAFVGRHVIEARPSLTRTIVPAVATLALIAAQVPRLSARADLPTEIEKSNTAIQRAEAAYQQAWRDVEAGRRTPDAAADDLADLGFCIGIGRRRLDDVHEVEAVRVKRRVAKLV